MVGYEYNVGLLSYCFGKWLILLGFFVICLLNCFLKVIFKEVVLEIKLYLFEMFVNLGLFLKYKWLKDLIVLVFKFSYFYSSCLIVFDS